MKCQDAIFSKHIGSMVGYGQTGDGTGCVALTTANTRPGKRLHFIHNCG